VLTPGLAFDRRGYRLGRGKAYYDRFLGQLPEGQVVKIGVGWNCQLCDELVIEPHDAQLDYFCSECEVLEFKPTD
jgi:5-formyltetrahydrofolate cyclo-ligase